MIIFEPLFEFSNNNKSYCFYKIITFNITDRNFNLVTNTKHNKN